MKLIDILALMISIVGCNKSEDENPGSQVVRIGFEKGHRLRRTSSGAAVVASEVDL